MIIKDPLYGYIKFGKDVEKLIDTPEFQRLRRIKQVFGSDFVYPGATHTRAEHSFGTAYLAKKMVKSIEEKLIKQEDKGLTDTEKKAVTLGGLLHDIGHGPFSHAFEPYLAEFDLTHEDFTRRIILERLSSKIEEVGVDPELVAGIAGGTETKTLKNRPYLKQIVSSAVDADKLDYLKRDAYHTGAEYGFIDIERIVNFINVYDGQICVMEKAIEAVEAMLIARALAFKSIYYHKASRAAQLLVSKSIKIAADELNLATIFDDLENFLAWDDYTLWSALLNTNSAGKYMYMLRDRRLLKVALSRKGSADRLSSDLINIFSSPRVRKEISKSIAEEAGITDPVLLDSPTLANIPYFHWIQGKSMEIPILSSTPSQEAIVRPISQISRTAKALESFIYAIRVYTLSQHRKKVRNAARKIFSGLTEKETENIHQ